MNLNNEKEEYMRGFERGKGGRKEKGNGKFYNYDLKKVREIIIISKPVTLFTSDDIYFKGKIYV